METFVIQIPTQPERTTEASGDELRGVVEHVGTGRRRPFTGASELLAFLEAHHRGLKEVEE